MGLNAAIRLARATDSSGQPRAGYWRTGDGRFLLTRGSGGWKIAAAAHDQQSSNHDLLARRRLLDKPFPTRRQAVEALAGALAFRDAELAVAETALTRGSDANADAMTSDEYGGFWTSGWFGDVFVVAGLEIVAHRRVDLHAWVDRALAHLRARADEPSDDEELLDGDDIQDALLAVDPPPAIRSGPVHADFRAIADDLAGFAHDEIDEEARRDLSDASRRATAAWAAVQRDAAAAGVPVQSPTAAGGRGVGTSGEHADRMPVDAKLRVAEESVCGDFATGWFGDILIIDDQYSVPGTLRAYHRADLLAWVDDAVALERESANAGVESVDFDTALFGTGPPAPLPDDDVLLWDAYLRGLEGALLKAGREETGKGVTRHLQGAADRIAAIRRRAAQR
jgi:hypothetical protein